MYRPSGPVFRRGVEVQSGPARTWHGMLAMSVCGRMVSIQEQLPLRVVWACVGASSIGGMAPLFAACALLHYYMCNTRLAWPVVGYWSSAERPFLLMGILLHFGCDGVSSIIGELGVGGWVFAQGLLPCLSKARVPGPS
jgi:dolichol kinase